MPRSSVTRMRPREQGATFKMVVSDEIFEFASSQWQERDDAEYR
ncbi:MAG: hypothetical protein QF921_04000 [Pseudomonadales bacterium]|nr:hypothetical protein [Pseudomonadales bacterium]MDP6471563.1 hypothetical protein [Pseudomonadales bacterium]MDP6828826.1 hypothetical protein [Pseudomonadales bacterium]MDP6970666.1 hypothetical protein [Pseudomonadales bacterium]